MTTIKWNKKEQTALQTAVKSSKCGNFLIDYKIGASVGGKLSIDGYTLYKRVNGEMVKIGYSLYLNEVKEIANKNA